MIDLSLSDDETSTSTSKSGGYNKKHANSNSQHITSRGQLETDVTTVTANNNALPTTSSLSASTFISISTFASVSTTSTPAFASTSKSPTTSPSPKSRTRLEASTRIIKFADRQRELRKSESDWMEAFERLVDYKEKHNHTRVPQHYKEDRKLGGWVKRQRSYCKVKYRIDLLNEIGFDWQIRHPDSWNVMYNRLLIFKEKYGTTRVPPNYEAEPLLSKWVRRQRYTCKNEGWIDRLNDIGFEWEFKKRSSLEMLKSKNPSSYDLPAKLDNYNPIFARPPWHPPTKEHLNG